MCANLVSGFLDEGPGGDEHSPGDTSGFGSIWVLWVFWVVFDR